LVAYNADD